MKRLLLIMLVSTVVAACLPRQEKLTLIGLQDSVVRVTIDYVGVYKYSSVKGHFTYGPRQEYVSNGAQGYYYKKYNLKPGDTAIVPVRIGLYKDEKDSLINMVYADFKQYERR